MPTSLDGTVLSRRCSCKSIRGILKPTYFNNVQDAELPNCFSKTILAKTEYNKVPSSRPAHISDITISEILKVQERRESKVINNVITASAIIEHENDINKKKQRYTTPQECYLHKYEEKAFKYGTDVHVFYVFNNPLQRLMGPREAQNTASCSVLCQIQNTKNTRSIFKRLGKILNEETKNETGLSRCCKTSNPCRARRSVGVQDPDKAMKRLVNLLTEPIECKCVSKKLKKKKKRTTCHCAEAETQSRRYGGQQQRAGRESFYREIGTSGDCNNKTCTNKNDNGNFFTRRIPGFNESYDYSENITPKCRNPSTRCQANGVPNDFPSFGLFFRKLIETDNCKRLACLKHIVPQMYTNKPAYGAVEAETQSRRYEERHQRAGRESFYRDRGITGIPMFRNNTFNPEMQVNPKPELNYENCEDLYDTGKPATMNRRIGSNGGCNMRCLNNVPDDTHKYAQSSVYSQLNGINDDSTFKKICNVLLEAKYISPFTQKYCTNRGTLCQEYNNEPGTFTKLFQSLSQPKEIIQDSQTGSLCNIDDSTLRKFCHMFHKAIKPVPTGAEATTQSRYYGGRQERAGREVFCRNKGTSGAPKCKCQKAIEEEYVEDIIDENDEVTTCAEPLITNKAVGLGTNCKFSLGWYKDRLAYGEPKPQNAVKDLKMAIDEWNEVPLRQTGTKIGASLNTDCGFTTYNTDAATQSRKYRGRHLRAGRETFFREQQTSCVPKFKKTIEEINNTIYQPIQPPPPDRKALRLGSDCSFCFEFYKDVPPESPENVNTKSTDNTDPTQNKSSFYYKFFRQHLASQVKSSGPNQVDACTCPCSTHTLCLDEEKVCECDKKRPKIAKPKPLHIGSKVSYNFNFSKSISPSKIKMAKGPCVSSAQEGMEMKRDEEMSSICVPTPCNGGQSDNMQNQIPCCELNSGADNEEDIKPMTVKECLLDLVTKKTLRRLIKGPYLKPVVKEEKKITGKKQTFLSHYVEQEMAKAAQFVCPAKCKTMKEPEKKPDQPFRVASSFSFDYNMHSAIPKEKPKEPNYKENFPLPEDFSGSPLKTNFFRLIVGKLRKRVKPQEVPRISTACPRECCNRGSKGWFSYILWNIKQRKHLNTSLETDAKNFFTDLLSKTSIATQSGQSSRRNCCKRKLGGIGREFVSYVLSNLKDNNYRPIDTESIKSFCREVLARKRFGRRRRRKRQGSSSGGYVSSYEYDEDDDDILSDNSFPPPRRKSRKSDEDYQPCCMTSECSFKCDYDKRDGSTDDTRSTTSTGYSRNYATT